MLPSQPTKISDLTVEQKHTKPRRYQLELFERAKKENVAIVLDTGTGKTMVAIMLIDYILNETHDNKKLVFIAENRILVTQQAEHIRKTLTYLKSERLEKKDDQTTKNIQAEIDGIVACYVGESGLLGKLHSNRELEKKKVIISTAAFLLNLLSHNTLQMESISLLIIDECHHCGDGDHPYKVIMTQYYHAIKQIDMRPKIFGMTASAIRSLSEEKALIQKQKLEAYLDCKLTTLSSDDELYNELREHTNLPNEIIATYDTIPELIQLGPLQDFCTEIIETLTKYAPIQPKDAMSCSNLLYNDFNYVLENLGSWGVKKYLEIILDHVEERKKENETPQISEMLIFSNDSSYQSLKSQSIELHMNDGLRTSLCNKLNKIFPKPSTSRKLQLLEDLINDHFFTKNDEQMRCLVFCERRQTAILLSRYFTSKGLPCDFIIGHNALSSRSKFGFKKNTGFEQKSKTEKFRSGDIKCLFCTNVVEEGFDVPACNLVIRFDKFTDFLRAYIQSRGRARKQESTFIMMVDSQDTTQQNLCKDGKLFQERMLNQITHNTSPQRVEDDILAFETPTKAKLTLNNSVRLYNQYCAVFPSQSADEKKPKFSIYCNDGEFVTEITFPTNCPVPVATITNNCEDDPHQYRYNKLTSKRYCAFKAIKYLHKYGELDDYLFPIYSAKRLFPSPYVEYTSSMATFLPQISEIFNWQEKKFNSNISTNPTHTIYIYDIFLDNNPTQFQFIIPNEIDADIEELELLNFRMSGDKNISIKKMGSASVGKDYIAQCFEYHDFIFRKVSKITIQEEKTSNEDWKFFIIPKNSQEHFTNMPVLEILERDGPMAETKLKNMILETIYNHRVYLLSSIEYDKNPNNPFETTEYKDFKTYYKEKWGLEIENPNQPLLRAYQPKFSTLGASYEHTQDIFLVPEFLTACSFNIDMMRFLKLAPEFLYRFYNRLITTQFAKRFSLFQPIVDITLVDGKTLDAFELLEEALTAKRSQVGVNYEKLEFYGDSVLSLIVSNHLYQEFPSDSSGVLSQLKHKYVSNFYLAYVARNTTLPLFIITEPLNNSQLVENINGFRPNRFVDETNTEIKYKVLADVVESVIGFCYHVFKGSLKEIHNFLEFIGIVLPKGDTRLTEDLKQPTLQRIYSEKISHIISHLEMKLNYEFNNKLLLTEALIHSSYNSIFNYERLEFLGDAVLGLLVTSKIFNEFHRNTGFTLGMMSKLREKIIKNSTFAQLCMENKFHNFIVFSGDQIANQIIRSSHINDDNEYVKILSDVFESIAGALFVESNCDLETVQCVYDTFLWEQYINETFKGARNNCIIGSVNQMFTLQVDNPIVSFISNNSKRDSSSVFNELLQQFVLNRLEKTDEWFQETSTKPNPPHNMVAKFSIRLFGMTFFGSGTSIKLAKKQASMECLQYLLENGEDFLKQIDIQLTKQNSLDH